ncbi:MAG: class I SAM-dependent methyltransferase [bacterium]|nr:class I SAM-dependent methyltransferase [bacterium]
MSECASCDHGFVNPQFTWDELAKWYSNEYQSYDASRIDEAIVASQVAAARERGGWHRNVRVEPGMDLLDYGSGAGLFLLVCKELGANAMGVDLYDESVERLRARGVEMFLGTLHDFVEANPDRRFDLITSSHVFEHLHDPVEALRLLGGLLKPGGRIHLAVPNAGSWGYRSLRGKWHATDLPRHLHQFTPKSMRELVQRSGLTLAFLDTESPPHATLHSIRQHLRHRFGIPQRVTAGVPYVLPAISKWLSRRLDAREAGEAIRVGVTAG